MRTQREKRREAASADPEASPLRRRRGPAAGSPLPADTQAHMGAAFGHDFSQVRIFADEDAAASAQGMGARAYTIGSDIFFNDRFFNPADADGRTLLAHELTHVVQQDRHGGGAGGRSGVSDPRDASEREASALAGRAAAGQRVQVRAAPTAAVSRGLLDWAEDKASAAWDGTKAVAGAVGGAVADEAKSEYADMKTMGGWVKKGEEAVGHGVDWVEDKEKAATSYVADKAKGIPVLEQVVGRAKPTWTR